MRARVTAAGAVFFLTVALAACVPSYPPHSQGLGDGVGITVGDGLKAENLLVIVSPTTQGAVLFGALSNESNVDADVDLAVDGVDIDPGTFTVQSHSTVLLQPSDVLVRLSAPPAPAGALATVQLAVPSIGVVSVEVPVLDTSLPQYADLELG